jgi:hypothetical protein
MGGEDGGERLEGGEDGGMRQGVCVGGGAWCIAPYSQSEEAHASTACPILAIQRTSAM